MEHLDERPAAAHLDGAGERPVVGAGLLVDALEREAPPADLDALARVEPHVALDFVALDQRDADDEHADKYALDAGERQPAAHRIPRGSGDLGKELFGRDVEL